MIRIDRPGAPDDRADVLRRGRKSIALDLKRAEAVAVVRDLAREADGLIEREDRRAEVHTANRLVNADEHSERPFFIHQTLQLLEQVSASLI